TPFIEDGLDNDRLGGEMPLVVTKYKIDVFVFRRGRPEWLETTQDCANGGYDLMGLTKQQVIDDVFERYEAHLAFLT
ncbi:hypothetical protein ABFV57_34840, partial [Pseudomonas neuropathica]|uniref:hypothetical protein n=1 Tax=Pseudomonas neuropathica TaxID=2730425 RepID=UPI0034D3A14F